MAMLSTLSTSLPLSPKPQREIARRARYSVVPVNGNPKPTTTTEPANPVTTSVGTTETVFSTITVTVSPSLSPTPSMSLSSETPYLAIPTITASPLQLVSQSPTPTVSSSSDTPYYAAPTITTLHLSTSSACSSPISTNVFNASLSSSPPPPYPYHKPGPTAGLALHSSQTAVPISYPTASLMPLPVHISKNGTYHQPTANPRFLR
ncbi:hypothetical protein PAAG_11382 [Paracoccidioides lutzii Pb01]|uniref:Uncharacterized protein n=1 Tax=Paracoccidioides lutzii (strain ATCC MYA-826 / Pb01) TaxID=502779 RepID=A0A0A2V6S4_PARBA|nr:hypothetical protein PAAG_11382 [Paracoccidioides lutzii Pb01]KGQ01810.1 hypothetical protein PAAG_11382 [Paracoccidioides lutzii Pb01]